MVHDFEAMLFGDLLLALFNDGVAKLNHLAGLSTDHVVVVIITRHFENSVTALKIMAQHQACGFKLREYSIHRRQTYVVTVFEQFFVDILRAQVVFLSVLENVKNLDSRQRNLETDFA